MLDRLYVNIGEKLKSWARWIFVVEAISAIIGGIAIMVDGYDDDSILIGLLVIAVGPLMALVSSWILYAFGQLVDNSDGILQELKEQKKKMGSIPWRTADELPRKPVKREEPKVEKMELDDVKTVYCTKCGKSQFDGRSTCFSCGAPLQK